MTTITPSAAWIELRREYKKWLDKFWQNHTSLAQIVVEDFPDAEDVEVRPTRYDVDSMRDLALRMGELVEGRERG